MGHVDIPPRNVNAQKLVIFDMLPQAIKWAAVLSAEFVVTGTDGLGIVVQPMLFYMHAMLLIILVT